jgi:hypothetical protein
MPYTIINEDNWRWYTPGARHIDVCQNGVIRMIVKKYATSTDHWAFYYSVDGGQTWQVDSVAGTISFEGLNETSQSFGGMFIDKDDYMHVLYCTETDQDPTATTMQWYYQRYEPQNMERTQYVAIQAPLPLDSSFSDVNAAGGGADLVVHREGTGWIAHCFIGTNPSGTATLAKYKQVAIAANGTYSENTGQAQTLRTAGSVTIWGIACDFRHEQTLLLQEVHLQCGLVVDGDRANDLGNFGERGPSSSQSGVRRDAGNHVPRQEFGRWGTSCR